MEQVLAHPNQSATENFVQIKNAPGKFNGHRVVPQDSSSNHLLYVLGLLGLIGIGFAAAGAYGSVGAFSTFAQVFTSCLLTVGGLLTLTSIIALFVISQGQTEQTLEKLAPVSESINAVINLENNGKQVATSVHELYKIAEDNHGDKQDKAAFLQEVKEILNNLTFQTNPKLYIEKWIMRRSKDTPLQTECLEFFCYLLREVDDPQFPWINAPTNH